MVPTAKRALSFEQIDAQTAVELPDRDMMALVNVFIPITVTDVLNNNEVNVQVPIGVAGKVCGVSVAAFAGGAATGPVDCSAATTQVLPVAFRPLSS
jgi:hypothetical protein